MQIDNVWTRCGIMLLTFSCFSCNPANTKPENTEITQGAAGTLPTVNLWRYGTGFALGSPCGATPDISFPNGALVYEDLLSVPLGSPSLCAIRWESPTNDQPPTIDAIFSHPTASLIDFEPMPLDMLAAGTAAIIDSPHGHALAETFRARAGDEAGWYATTSPLKPPPMPPPQIGTHPVTVLVVDDLVQPVGAAGRSWTQTLRMGNWAVGWHGGAIARMIEEFACPWGGADPASCPIKVKALSAFTSQVAPGGGVLNAAPEKGSHGDMLSLSRALVNGVVEFNLATQGSNQQHSLVINLSLGMIQQAFDAHDRQGEVLQDALQFAACNGAFIIAAAGNDQSHRTSYMFTAPADGIPTVKCDTQPYTVEPILAAVVGLKTNGIPLSINRPFDRSAFTVAATGQRITPDFSGPNEAPLYKAQVTGTSGATAVVSAAVAAALSISPNFDRSDMRLMFQAMSDRAPLLWIGGDSALNVPVVRVLEAVQWACSQVGCAETPVPFAHGLQEIDTVQAFYDHNSTINAWTLPPQPSAVPSEHNAQVSCLGACRPLPTPWDEITELVTMPPTKPVCNRNCEFPRGPVPVIMLTQNPPREFIGGARTLELSNGTTGVLVPLTATSSGAETINIQSALSASGMTQGSIIQARIIYEDDQGVSRAEEIGRN